MKLRKEFNDRVQEVGNRLYDGLGDVLTKKVRLATPLAIAGAFALTALAGHGVCQSMYNSGIVQGMYSCNIYGYTISSWMGIGSSLYRWFRGSNGS
jgi:2,3-bisphosphoglycerate-independent phosphoglycerate mutase